MDKHSAIKIAAKGFARECLSACGHRFLAEQPIVCDIITWLADALIQRIGCVRRGQECGDLGRVEPGDAVRG